MGNDGKIPGADGKSVDLMGNQIILMDPCRELTPSLQGFKTSLQGFTTSLQRFTPKITAAMGDFAAVLSIIKIKIIYLLSPGIYLRPSTCGRVSEGVSLLSMPCSQSSGAIALQGDF